MRAALTKETTNGIIMIKTHMIVFSFLLVMFLQLAYSQSDGYIVQKEQIALDSLESESPFRLGLRIDFNFVSEKTITNTDVMPKYEKRIHSYTHNFISPISIYMPMRLIKGGFFDFEFRPGLIFSGDELSSYTLGLFCHFYPLIERIYLSTGFENSKHLNPVKDNPHPGNSTKVLSEITGA